MPSVAESLRDGSYGWFEITDAALKHDPVVHAIVTTARDVTVRKESAQNLIDLSLRTRLLVRQSVPLRMRFGRPGTLVERGCS